MSKDTLTHIFVVLSFIAGFFYGRTLTFDATEYIVDGMIILYLIISYVKLRSKLRDPEWVKENRSNLDSLSSKFLAIPPALVGMHLLQILHMYGLSFLYIIICLFLIEEGRRLQHGWKPFIPIFKKTQS